MKNSDVRKQFEELEKLRSQLFLIPFKTIEQEKELDQICQDIHDIGTFLGYIDKNKNK